ncbi:MAG TPA: hypothetical protein DCY55_00685 [Gammaproteobacteria bacterium]|mgnify:CR=1 FL=1|jgi:hypothetical protein|nr:hypothetical protein [Gammaproteobacteria bacterium]
MLSAETAEFHAEADNIVIFIEITFISTINSLMQSLLIWCPANAYVGVQLRNRKQLRLGFSC